MHSNHYGDTMTTKTRPQFNPEFKVEYAQLVLDQRYSIREAADAMNVGRPERASLNLRG
jgi:transposase-like protein